MPQPDLLLAEEQFAASAQQVLPISGATDLDPSDLLGVAHAPLMRAPIAVFQIPNSAPAVSQPINALEVAAMEELGDALCEFPDVFSSSKTGFGYGSLMPFKTSVPEGSAPVSSRLYRINRISAKEVNATLNQYLAAGLIQHSTSLYSSPLMVCPTQSGGVRITAIYKKLNGIGRFSQLPIPRVDQVLAVVSPDNHPQGHSSTHGILHPHGSLQVAGYASG